MPSTLITFKKVNATVWDVFDLITACATATSLAYRFAKDDEQKKILRGMAVYPDVDFTLLQQLYPSFQWKTFQTPHYSGFIQEIDQRFTEQNNDSTKKHNTL